MRHVWTSGMILAAMIGGCESANAPKPTTPIKPPATQSIAPASDPLIASINTSAGLTQIRRSSFETAVINAYGFKVLMYLVQHEMAKDACRKQGLVVSADDFAKERKYMLDRILGDVKDEADREKLLEQYFQQPKPVDEGVTPSEFEMVVETNAYLRKLAETRKGNLINDEELKLEFDRVYGAQVHVRHIMISNTQEALEVKRRLDAGEEFAKVAQALSRNPNTKLVGGDLPSFTAGDARLPATFRNVAFSLKEGEVSDPVEAEGSFHIIKLEQKISPKVVKFEDVKDSLRESIEERFVFEAVKDLRNKLAAEARASLKIEEPALKAEFDKRLRGREKVVTDRDQLNKDFIKQRQAIAAPATSPATKPAAQTTTPAVVAPASKPVAAAAPGGATTKSVPAVIPATQP